MWWVGQLGRASYGILPNISCIQKSACYFKLSLKGRDKLPTLRERRKDCFFLRFADFPQYGSSKVEKRGSTAFPPILGST